MSWVGELLQFAADVFLPDVFFDWLLGKRERRVPGLLVGEPRIVPARDSGWSVTLRMQYEYAFKARQYRGEIVRTFQEPGEADAFLRQAKSQNLWVRFVERNPHESSVEFAPQP